MHLWILGLGNLGILALEPFRKKVRATASEVAKLCKIQKVVNFTHFNEKNTHINVCKIVHIYKSAIVTVHICIVTIALHTNVLSI